MTFNEFQTGVMRTASDICKCCVGISHRTDGMSGIPIFTPLVVRLHTALKCMQTRLHGVTESTQRAHLEEQVQVLLQQLDFS